MCSFILLRSHFVKLSSHLRDCNRQDDWLSCQNIIRIFAKPIQSCPLDYTNFILFHDVNILLLTFALSLKLIHFFSSFLFFHQYYLVIFVKLYDHMPHFLFFSCINFALLNDLYQHTYTIMHLMYDIFVLFHVLYFFHVFCECLYVYMYSVLQFFRPS